MNQSALQGTRPGAGAGVTNRLNFPAHRCNEANIPGVGVVKFLNLQVVNDPTPKWMSRQAATDCWGTITFHREDGQAFIVRAMSIRWPRTPEPVPAQIVIEGMRPGQIVDLGRLLIPARENIPPGERAPMNVAARFGDEADCYRFSNESYPAVSTMERWGHPPQWRLGPGTYLINVTVYASGEQTSSVFRLINDATRADFRLERGRPTDQVRLPEPAPP
jgi:hypothetical protein